MAVLIVYKIDFLSELVRRDRGHYMVVKGSVHQEDITVVNIYELNIATLIYESKSQYMNQNKHS